MNEIIFGDCRESLRRMAADGARAQMCVTSPPYYGLRDYGVDGQLGLEQTPDEYVATMVEVFRAVRDVLADDGTLWLNLGDSYAGAGYSNHANTGGAQRQDGGKQKHLTGTGLKPKDLIGMPWRLAFALQADGWYLRQDIIWHKPNPMPESVRDRCTKAHEYIFLLSKSKRYFFDQEAMKEPAVGANLHDVTGRTKQRGLADTFKRKNSKRAQAIPGQAVGTHREDRADSTYDIYTRNRRSVWTVATRPYKGAHFATFPPALIEPCILAGTSARGHCPACGARWMREVEREFVPQQDVSIDRGRRGAEGQKPLDASNTWQGTQRGTTHATTTGWRSGCACGLEPVPDIVLDPFMGSGTTAAVALQLGRQYLGCELNEDYRPLQDERIAAAMPKEEKRPTRRERGQSVANDPRQICLF